MIESTHTKKILFSLGLITMLSFTWSNIVHAQTEDNEAEGIAPLVSQFLDDQNTSDNTQANDESIKKEKEKKKAEDESDDARTDTESETQDTPTTVSTSSPQATPTQQRENQSVKDQPRNDPEYNEDLESILNTSLPPAEEPKKESSKKPFVEKTTTTSEKSVATSTATTTDDSEATSTPAGGFTHTSNGASNQFLPSNYYIPLDSLSPESTYALSGLAMIFGIVGATLILRDNREEEPVWIPAFSEQSLQES
jgi:outer membrane biosynthesis protein TonB